MAKRGGRYYDNDSWFPPPSVPRKVKGGIKAQSKRGAFGASWWARRWVDVLESFHIGARLARGRNYARRGQVTDIRIEEGKVTAKVQGSRPSPYRVSIEVKTLTLAQWKKVAARLGEEALYAAKLLAGEIPQEVEKVFQAAGVTLFPSRGKDLATECSCPDWSNPCKHIAAVYYLLGEEFDRDPFLIFKLRGMSRSGLMELLGDAPAFAEEKPTRKSRARTSTRSSTRTGTRTSTRTRPTGSRAAPSPEAQPTEAEEPASSPSPPEPLPSDPTAFWGRPLSEDEMQEPWAVPVPEAGAALARRLGSFPFWRGRESLPEVMDRAYPRAAFTALEVLASAAAGGAGRRRRSSSPPA